MRRFIAPLVLAAALMLAPMPASHAARDQESDLPAGTARLSLVVIEAEGCIYCRLFRRDVLPGYKTSARSKELPIRFLDINEAEGGSLALSGPVDLVPTVVLIRDGREIGRIPGYVGPENFYHTVNYLLGTVPAE